MMFSISFVCLGNICRSPMAHVVMNEKLAATDLAPKVRIASSGTGNWHVGEPIDPRAGNVLIENGYNPSAHRASNFTIDWFAEHDLILAMDSSNFADIVELAPSVAEQNKVRMFREFDPLAITELDVPDPWFGGVQGFHDVLNMVERTVDNLLTNLPALIEQKSAD